MNQLTKTFVAGLAILPLLVPTTAFAAAANEEVAVAVAEAVDTSTLR